LSEASILIERRQDAEAAVAAQRAIALGAERWSVLAGAGDVLRLAGRDSDSIAALDRALALAANNEDRADALSYRAYAHRFAGRLDAAAADAQAALALDRTDAVRFMAVSVLMDHPRNWREGVTIARELFAEQPDSGLRLNALGYSLIQRPEGLEEGYRLLWRGFNVRSSDYAIIDSLGWAYYLYGAMDEARALVERANELSRDDPNPEILDHLGDIYWRVRERERAREAWTDALAARPDAIRRASLETKLARGLSTPAPTRRPLPRVDLPRGPRERGDL
jgi:tetratricopeptide (TPR) repeat protein